MTENNWKQECEDFVNKQIAMEYWASLQYHAISSYFNNQSVGLENISKFFNKCSLEEREHADKLVDYQNKRGGNVVIYQVTNIDNKFYNPESEKLKFASVIGSRSKADAKIAGITPATFNFRGKWDDSPP